MVTNRSRSLEWLAKALDEKRYANQSNHMTCSSVRSVKSYSYDKKSKG